MCLDCYFFNFIYKITYFGVGRNVDNFKTTYHEYVVNLCLRTDVHRLAESSSIPQYEFSFVNFDTLNASRFDYIYLVGKFIILQKINSLIDLFISSIYFSKIINNKSFLS
ncbi:hypothetical protein AHAS_Ahas14G0120100 [Arachis hypogaea]